jgi:hypothetical protein
METKYCDALGEQPAREQSPLRIMHTHFELANDVIQSVYPKYPPLWLLILLSKSLRTSSTVGRLLVLQ